MTTQTKDIFNFSPGPSMLPVEVMQQAQSEFLNWHDTGMSIMEMSHRGKAFMEVAERTEANLRELLSIPQNYKVLFLQGGATGQFATIPMNLLAGKTKADYIYSGSWAKKAIAEAKRYCDVNIAASVIENEGLKSLPQSSSWQLSDDAAYLHYTSNETIDGIEFFDTPDVDDSVLVADMSSNILSSPLDVAKFGLIYAGAQKNCGMAGLTIVIVREDLLGKAASFTPSVLNYELQAQQDSMLNTPPTFAWYLTGLVFEWALKQGGVAEMDRRAQSRSQKLYRMIDESDFYHNPVDPSCRSRMNIPFTLKDGNLDKEFLQQAEQQGLLNLKGHRSVGGMRASIYNAMPEAGVDKLISMMKDFEKQYG